MLAPFTISTDKVSGRFLANHPIVHTDRRSKVQFYRIGDRVKGMNVFAVHPIPVSGTTISDRVKAL